LADAFPEYGEFHGFNALVPFPSSARGHLVCLFAIDTVQPAPNPLLGCVGAPGRPFGVVDHVARIAEGVQVWGWAIDPDTADPIAVHVYVQGVGFALNAEGSR